MATGSAERRFKSTDSWVSLARGSTRTRGIVALRIMREAGLLEVEKQGKERFYGVTRKLKGQVAANNNVLDLGCCTFRFDKLPK